MADLDPVRRFYDLYDEDSRLETGPFRLERARTSVLMTERLPPPPAVVFDVGGGPGVYACELAARGYVVHLIDLSPTLVARALARAGRQPERPLASATVGDARALEMPDACADAVLLFGPLYHLQERADRLAALQEARRVLEPGGVLMAAAISRYASLLEGLHFGTLAEPDFRGIVERDLATGRHANPSDNLHWFTDAYFHEPEELAAEVAAAGFEGAELRAIEGVGWLVPDLDARWTDPTGRAELLEWVARTDRAPSILGVSAHLMAIARAPEA